VIGISIHHDCAVGVLIDMSTRVVPESKQIYPLPTGRARDRVVDSLLHLAKDIYDRTVASKVLGIGVTIAGVVSAHDLGHVHYAPDLRSDQDEWRGVPLEQLLQDSVRKSINKALRVVVENDANALAMQEHLQSGDESVLVVLLTGAGIGMGSVIGGQVVRGVNFCAGEGGHTVIDPNGPECRAGLGDHRGCLESLVSFKAILDRLNIDAPGDHIGKGLTVANELLNQGSVEVAKEFHESSAALGRFLSMAVALIDPARIVFYAPEEIAGESWNLTLGRNFRDSLAKIFQRGLPKDGRLSMVSIFWRVLDEDVTAAAAGAGAMREFLQRPEVWRPSVLPLRTLTQADRVTV
jgi:predicted NBD/HSP70 family sugar kinase